MRIFRTYGNKPYTIAVIHGGPGAGGEMAPIARHLSKKWGILEPIQTKKSIQEQIQELRENIDENCSLPVILIGYSWGAWLSLLFSAEYMTYAKKVILIGSGPFEESYVEQLRTTRMNRFSKEQKQEFDKIIIDLDSITDGNRDEKLQRLGHLSSITDNFNPMSMNSKDRMKVKASGDIYKKVWGEASVLRKQGLLLEKIKTVTCPVTAIHGEYDPHPYEGVKRPLSRILKNFKLHLLKKCGHTPWCEKEASKEFYRILITELAKISHN
ncbi:MAG: alpha/beta fold hydrolase [Candidatus Hodarchaeales archaeon]|jgi:pimeloyl-ACP methyl ester carboxylesterase